MTIEISALKVRLEEIERISQDAWIDSLSARKLEELKFHDKHRDKSKAEQLDKDTYEKIYGNRKYYTATALSKEYVNSWIRGNVKGKIFLDYACGNGSNAIKAAKAGAKLAIGLDVSFVSIENCKAEARKEGVEANTYFVQADAENTKLPDSCIDVIICSGMLHHLDMSYAFPELRRILIPGGKLLAVEALDYNPSIKLYRYLTPAMRTEWEKVHILSLKDVRFAERFFNLGEIKYWHILEILSPHLKFASRIFQVIDRVLTRIPLIQLMAWVITFELIKRKDE